MKLKKIHEQDEKQYCTPSPALSGTTGLASPCDPFQKEELGAALSKPVQVFGTVLRNGSSGFRCKLRRVLNSDLYCKSSHCSNEAVMQKVPSTFFHWADLHCGCWGDEVASLQQLHQNTDKTGTPDVPCSEEKDALCLLRSLGKLHICHIRFRMVMLFSIFLYTQTSLFYGSWIIHGLLSHSHLPVWQQGFQRWDQSSVSLAVQRLLAAGAVHPWRWGMHICPDVGDQLISNRHWQGAWNRLAVHPGDSPKEVHWN